MPFRCGTARRTPLRAPSVRPRQALPPQALPLHLLLPQLLLQMLLLPKMLLLRIRMLLRMLLLQMLVLQMVLPQMLLLQMLLLQVMLQILVVLAWGMQALKALLVLICASRRQVQLRVMRALAMSVTHSLPRSVMQLRHPPLLLQGCSVRLSRLGCLHRALLGLRMLRALLMRSRRKTGSLTA